METNRKIFDPHSLARLQGLRLRARSVVEGYVAGLHRSPFRGYSIEFSEHRDYVPGDDLRYVDWKVLARNDRLAVKQFEDETNLVCHLLVDVSESMLYQSDVPLSKLEYAQSTAAAIGYLVLLGQDSAGVMTLDGAVRGETPPLRTADHLARICDLLEEPLREGFERATQPSLSGALCAAAERMKRRGVVVVVSDMLEEAAKIVKAVGALRRQRHDVIMIQVQDPAEAGFPFDSPTLFRGLEGMGDMLVDSAKLAAAYREAVADHRHTLEQGCLDVGSDFLAMSTDQPMDEALATYLARRAQWVR